MKLKSIILGIAVTTVLLGVLVATRMMVLSTKVAEFEIREIETVSLPEPPPPPEESMDEDVPPPPPPALADLAMTPDISQPALPVVKMQMTRHLAVDTFFTDQPPAPLPTVVRPKPRPVAKPTVKTPVRPAIKLAPPKPKSQYSLSELDKKPRLLRNPSVTFPRSIRSVTSGRVVVSRPCGLLSCTMPARPLTRIRLKSLSEDRSLVASLSSIGSGRVSRGNCR